jgi:IPTL-CTERM motif
MKRKAISFTLMACSIHLATASVVAQCVACCIPGGSCQMLTLEECTAQGGASYSSGDCAGTVSVHGVINCWDYLNPSLPSGVPVNLDAGWWMITVTGDPNPPPPGGFNNDAYSPWGCDICNPTGGGAWEWAVDAIHEDGHYVLHGWSPTPTPYSSTQGDALAANIGGSTLIHLDAQATVYFGIGDIICGDNRGGVTVTICRPLVCEGDADHDLVDAVCGDLCPSDTQKLAPGRCGCGVPETEHCGAIPTVSEWGLVVLTLLLLTGSKIAFGRRPWVPI